MRLNMNKLLYWLLSAVLICCSTMLTSCSDGEIEDNTLSDKIIGKWIIKERNDIPLTTNLKVVYSFVNKSDNIIVYRSLSQEKGFWEAYQEMDCKIRGNTVYSTEKLDEHNSIVYEISFKTITETELQCTVITTMYEYDTPTQLISRDTERWVRLDEDYKSDIVGTWEGRVTSESSEFDDGETHRWKYNNDGTYEYQSQNENGQWVSGKDSISEYFVDGILLCTRWINNNVESREWWEIESINNGVMKWTALRQYPNGKTYNASFSMTKVAE